MSCSIDAPTGGKVEQFLNEVENGGVMLTEGERYIKDHPASPFRMVKPWDIYVD